MNNVTIVSDSDLNSMGVTLHNGDLVVKYYTNSKNPVGVFIVTSFRNSKKTNPDRWDITNKYCSLVSLEDGKIAFEEPCSRSTTYSRIRGHLSKSNYPADVEVRVFTCGEYHLNIDLCGRA